MIQVMHAREIEDGYVSKTSRKRNVGLSNVNAKTNGVTNESVPSWKYCSKKPRSRSDALFASPVASSFSKLSEQWGGGSIDSLVYDLQCVFIGLCKTFLVRASLMDIVCCGVMSEVTRHNENIPYTCPRDPSWWRGSSHRVYPRSNHDSHDKANWGLRGTTSDS